MDNIPENVKIQMNQMKQWISTQQHFPKNIEDKLVLRFLHSCYYNMEKAKTTAELFFNIRTSAPEILSNRDPMSPPLQKALSIVKLAQYQTEGKVNIWIWQLNDPGLDNYDYLMDAKLFFLLTDSWLLRDDFLEEEDIVILDVKDISLKFLTKFNVSIAKKLSKYQEDALPIRLKGVHLINSPTVIDKIFGLLKPFLKQELTNMIHFHTPKSKTLFDYVNKDELPSDYGGSRSSLDEYNASAIELLMKKRNDLTSTLWINEKPSKNKADTSTEIGSFRTLAID